MNKKSIISLLAVVLILTGCIHIPKHPLNLKPIPLAKLPAPVVHRPALRLPPPPPTLRALRGVSTNNYVWKNGIRMSTNDMFFFAATAYSGAGLESYFSNESGYTNSMLRTNVCLAWDASTSAGVTGYRLHKGRASGWYTNVTDVGNVTNACLPLYPPPSPRLTNYVVHAWSTNATNLQWTTSLTPPIEWNLVGATNYFGTNVYRPFWRALGKRNSTKGKAFVSVKWQ